MVGRTVQRPDHQHEVLRMAALLASISGGVADVEREVLVRLAKEFSLPAESVMIVFDEVHQALGLGT